MPDKGALTGSSPLLNLSIQPSLQDTDTQSHPSTSVSTPPESQAGYMATPTAQNTFPLLCLADPYLSSESHTAPLPRGPSPPSGWVRKP